MTNDNIDTPKLEPFVVFFSIDVKLRIMFFFPGTKMCVMWALGVDFFSFYEIDLLLNLNHKSISYLIFLISLKHTF